MTDENLEIDRYSTIAAGADSELKVQRSRFLASVHPAADETAARARIEATRDKYHDARHVCYAWRLGPPPDTVEVRSDAGEPSGSAGEPILNVLRKAELVNVVAIVVRYFGGVKLGTGGLSRAYREAAESATALAPVQEVLLGDTFDLEFPYNLRKTIHHLLDEHAGRIITEHYGETIQWRIWLGVRRIEDFGEALENTTNGRIRIRTST